MFGSLINNRTDPGVQRDIQLDFRLGSRPKLARSSNYQ